MSAGATKIYADRAQLDAVAASLQMTREELEPIFGTAGRDGTVSAIRAFVLSRLGPTYEQIEAGARAPDIIPAQTVQVVVAAGAAAGWFLLYDVATAEDTTVRIVAAREQVQAVATSLSLPLEEASGRFGRLCQDGTIDAVRRYMAGRLGVTAEDIEANAVEGKVLDPIDVQIMLGAGEYSEWFASFQIAPAVQP